MKKVIITGANGFIGRQCIPYLIEKNYEVHCIYNSSVTDKNITDKNATNKNIEYHKCNLLNNEEQKNLIENIQPTHLLHFAWYTEHGKYWNSNENFKWVCSGMNLLKNFIDNGGKRIVIAGTCAEYDWNYSYYSESTPTNPSSLYGICKNTFHKISDNFLSQKNVSYSWGRIFYPYGDFENSNRLIPYTINSLLLNEQVNCRNENFIRDFLYVKDVASAFVELLDCNIKGSINIASGQPVVLKDLIYNIADILEKRHLIKFTKESLNINKEPNTLLADVGKLKNELKWSQKYSLSEGLSETINWWKNEKHNYFNNSIDNTIDNSIDNLIVNSIDNNININTSKIPNIIHFMFCQ